ncbi:MAG: hypothetical protein IT230_11200 [Flavobacteriales bacterium]|nr:hypothetical protein [Flavobacteriales bacterium]
MRTPILLCGGIALLLLGCSRTQEPVAEATDQRFENQLLAVLPHLGQGTVLKVCNTNDQPGDKGVLEFSIVPEKPDPANPGKLLPVDPLTTAEQLAAILPLVDQRHSFNIRSVAGRNGGQPQLVFTIEPVEEGLN